MGLSIPYGKLSRFDSALPVIIEYEGRKKKQIISEKTGWLYGGLNN